MDYKPQLSQSEINWWLNEIDACEKRQKDELITRNSYPELIRYYEGMLSNKTDGDRVVMKDRAAILNAYFPNTNALISEILYQLPEFTAEARKPSAEPGIGMMTSAIKYAFKETGALEEERICVFDALLAGYGAIEVGHAIEDEQYVRLPSEGEEQPEKGLIEGLVDGIKSIVSPQSAQEAEDKITQEQPDKTDLYETTDRTYISRIDPLDWMPDWRANRLKDCRYYIKKVKKSTSEFNQAYPAFKNQAKGTDIFDYGIGDSEKNAVTCYHIQIRKKGKEFYNLVLTPSIKNSELAYSKRPYYMDGFNIKILTFHKYGRIYPISIGKINKIVADEANEYVKFLKDVAEKSIPKRVATRGTLKQDAKIALNNSVINDIVEVEGGTGALGNLDAPQVSNDNKQVMQVLDRESQKLWSISQERLGVKGGAEFATELKIQEAGFQMKTTDLQDGLQQFLEEQGDAAKDIIWQLWDTAMWLKTQDKQWIEPKTLGGIVVNSPAEELTGDYAIKVNVSSAMRPNPLKDRQDAVEFMNIITGPNVTGVLQAAGIPLDVVIESIKKVAEKYGVDPAKFEPQAAQAMPGQPPIVQPETIPPGGEVINAPI